jgi:GNAT superfamily N-acetyltransferase
MVDVRPMCAGDVADAYAIAMRAFEMEPPAGRSERQRRDRRWHVRLGHLLATDPGGAWFAESEGRPAGAAMALVRDRRVWGLSLLVVEPGTQSQGIGARLLGRALAHGEGVAAGIVVASTDARALRVYARAGFSLLPTLSAAGSVDRSALPGRHPAVREAGPEWLEQAGEISRAVRGATHAPDMAVSLTVGERLLHIGRRGFVMHDRGSVRLLAARDDEAATALLWSALAESDGSVPAEVNWVTGGQDWAVDVAVRAGLELRVTGPVCVRGTPGPLRPYLPSGAYL